MNLIRVFVNSRDDTELIEFDKFCQLIDYLLLTEETFALAQEKLIYNKLHGPRRAIEPSILQGVVHFRQCSFAPYRNSSRTSARKIYYHLCSGSDAYRHAGKAICDQKPIRQDLLDQLVWTEILRLPEDPALTQNELNRRLEAARQFAVFRSIKSELAASRVQPQRRAPRAPVHHRIGLPVLANHTP
ncbi:MAG: hypothetical protein PHO08_10890 [Methylococcales bacterium]|nr:hypothetical protein [Methylococcales bacterium]